MADATTCRMGADVGGTFTDVILVDGQGRVWTRKVPSTPRDFEQAVLLAAEQLLNESQVGGSAVSELAHGTTVATNAILEQRGARTALVTTKGFRDVLELRRIRAPQLYDLFFEKPRPLVDRYLRFELSERISASGEVLVAPSESELFELKDRLIAESVESIAVCFLHSYAFPRHEQIAGDFFREHLPHVHLSLSCEVLRERREYERTATTVVNAYVQPVVQRYLQTMSDGLQELGINAPLLIMQSSGGLTPGDDASRRPVYALESGPAAGVLAAGHTARQLGIENVISFDMGGTTAKASIIEADRISYSPEYEVGAALSAGNRLVGGGGELIRAPTIDIAEVGAGGGSIASVDRGGGLRVGPHSAGAVPGPVCYNQGGTQATLTDANVVLGFIRPGRLADGQVCIDPEAARRAIHDQIAKPLGMTLLEAADGIHRIANARTMRALREVSTQRGRDPREFSLIAFGGSGPIHAAGLARELSAQQIVVPPLPGLFSALGLLFSGVEHHDARSCRLSGDGLTAGAVRSLTEEMHQSMLQQFETEGFIAEEVVFNSSVDIRFRGQTSEIRIRMQDVDMTEHTIERMHADFEDEHERLYGHRSDPDNPVEVVAVRLIGQERSQGSQFQVKSAELESGHQSTRCANFGPQWGEIDTPIVARSQLSDECAGPLLIDEYDSTIVVPPDVQVHREPHGNIVMRMKY